MVQQSYGVDADHLICRLVYGVGMRLVTSQGAAVPDGDGEWRPAAALHDLVDREDVDRVALSARGYTGEIK